MLNAMKRTVVEAVVLQRALYLLEESKQALNEDHRRCG